MINDWFVCLDLSDCFVADLFIKLINHNIIVLPYKKYVISYVIQIVLHVSEMDVFIGMYDICVYIDGEGESTLEQDILKIQMRTI